MELNVGSLFQSARRRNANERPTKTSSSVSKVLPKGYLAIVAIVVIITLQFSTPARSASFNKRSTEQDVCRTNGICGWEVYHPSTRNLQYYVASSCKCNTKEVCFKVEDDVSISAYVFRCRDPRRRKTTRRPPTNDSS